MSAASQRLPVSVITSLALHVGLFAFLYTAPKKANLRVIGNVDLMIQVRNPAAFPKPAAKSPTPPSTWNFLKMALPAVPKIEPRRLEVKIPEAAHKALMQEKKLDDRGRRQAAQRLEALDLSEKRVDMAKIESKMESRRTADLAALPRLEEVGRRQVRNLPAAIALEERRQEAVSLQAIGAMNVETHRRVGPAMEAIQEAAPAQRSRFAEKISSMLPTQEPAREITPQMREAPDAFTKKVFVAPAPQRRTAAEALPEKKKGVEIEGPLADRKVVAYDVPEFPAWAKDQGVLEAAVAIRFWVSRDGAVLPNMRIEHTSGYGRLDRLAVDALKNWKFAPLLTEERQWGVITFRFILE